LYADPDPDTAAQINADPCGSGSETLPTALQQSSGKSGDANNRGAIIRGNTITNSRYPTTAGTPQSVENTITKKDLKNSVDVSNSRCANNSKNSKQ
jgi:hypothetical protein